MHISYSHIITHLCHEIYRKLPSYLTIQKPDFVNRLSVSSFAASIKPPTFDGSNYKSWQERLILWLTISRVIHVKDGKPEQFTPEEESAFDGADTLFRGCVISVLAENLVDSYVLLPTGKKLWDALCNVPPPRGRARLHLATF